MRIIYWIYTAKGWQKTNADTYYAHAGSKKITNEMGLGWDFVERMLVRYRYR